MRAGLAPSAYVDAFWRAVQQAGTDWTPGLVLVSAGFDSMRGDLLGGFTLEPEHYGELVARMRERFPGVPLAAILEGGYVPPRVAAAVVEVARRLA
jgi:acetoin utilization deacetylase AcuC-like enzyme